MGPAFTVGIIDMIVVAKMVNMEIVVIADENPTADDIPIGETDMNPPKKFYLVSIRGIVRR